MGKKPPHGYKKKKSKGMGMIAALIGLVGVVYVVFFMLSKRAPTPAKRPTSENAQREPLKERVAQKSASSRRSKTLDANKHSAVEWSSLPRDMDACISSQEELMTIPAPWPGFHALCIEAAPSADSDRVTVLLHSNSGDKKQAAARAGTTRPLHASGGGGRGYDAVVSSLISSLKDELLEYEFEVALDPMISTSAYDFTPNPWKLFTQRGGAVETDGDLMDLGPGAALFLYTGGQFIWPGVRLGHKTEVPLPVTDGTPGGHKLVQMETLSLRPLVLALSGFLSDDECDFIKKYASTRMVPSGLAMMDSSGDSRDVRTSTQTFMERNGSPQIRALEERAHNLTRLPYDLGENIQVVRYEVGQKYGAHRDFFNPNDYHKQPSMLRNVEYGGRNRLATVFWYLESVSEGGETFFPRALNAKGQEYHRWNGDHEDCYRGLYVPPVRGNAVLFYSMVPDGRLDERSLHGGCKPRGDHVEKWGANQWIWNHPQRPSGVAPRRGAAKPSRAAASKGRPGCEDSDSNCAAWAEAGECSSNPRYMNDACKASCNAC